MFKARSVCLLLACVLLLLLLGGAQAVPRPRPQQEPTAAVEPSDLESGVDAEEKDLQGASSYGYGYYSSPYFGGGHYGGYGGYGGGWPYYGGGGYYGLGYPYYGGYYGLHHHHGHYGHYY